MILVDTSVWLDHFREANPKLQELLLESRVLMHPFVAGEIACGNLPHRDRTLESLEKLPLASLASHGEAMRLAEERRLWGLGIGWVDAHLLASALISGCLLWTLDQRLRTVARRLGLGFS